ncbi:hypothetical protein D3C83_310840 [compost metagenome]
MVERHQQPGEDVFPFAGTGEVVVGAARDHLASMFEEIREHFLERQDVRLVVDEGEHDDAKGGL